MKKSALLNSELSYVIAKMGHTDTLTVGDCGLPIPQETQRIDLALRKGTPGFLERTVCAGNYSGRRDERCIPGAMA